MVMSRRCAGITGFAMDCGPCGEEERYDTMNLRLARYTRARATIRPSSIDSITQRFHQPTTASHSLTMFLLLASSLLLWVVFYATWSAVTLEQNYRRASTMGIPLVRVPVDPLNIPWQVVEPHFWTLIDYLHLPLPRNSVLLRRGWHFHVKADMHEEMGTVWAIVTPGGIHLNVCDAEALREIFARRGDFVRPREFYSMCTERCLVFFN